jgi:hypothetical protein
VKEEIPPVFGNEKPLSFIKDREGRKCACTPISKKPCPYSKKALFLNEPVPLL